MARKKAMRCENCVFWRRNEEFPNKYGKCRRPFVPTVVTFPMALVGAETHERFFCSGFDLPEHTSLEQLD